MLQDYPRFEYLAVYDTPHYHFSRHLEFYQHTYEVHQIQIPLLFATISHIVRLYYYSEISDPTNSNISDNDKPFPYQYK